jgi:valyl-tRNA synthetase
MTAHWPERRPQEAAAEAEVALLRQAIVAVRNIRSEMNVNPGVEVEAIFLSVSEASRAVLQANEGAVRKLARVGKFEVASPEGHARPRQAAAGFAGDVEVFLPLAGLIDFAEEERRLAKELAKAEKEIAIAQKKLANEDFVARAPEEVIDKERAKEADANSRRAKIKAGIERLSAMRSETP